MKLIVRADDLGFSEAVNYGIEKAVKDGIVMSVGFMVNMEASLKGWELIKKYDQVCVGQHTNICVGKPVSDPSLIPSLVNSTTNEFCSSKEIRARAKDTIVFEEAMIEIEAQLARFIDITGQNPAYFEGHAVFSANFMKALEAVAEKHNLFYSNPMDPSWVEKTGIQCGKWFTADENGLYDPIKYLINDEADILKHDCAVVIFHPGYVDQFIMKHSSFNMIRILEVEALCSPEVSQWIQENRIQLVNFVNYKD